VQSRTNEELLGKLVEKLLADIADKNAQIIELTKQKHLIESNLGAKVNDEELDDMKQQL
jgi:hypothetical protein